MLLRGHFVPMLGVVWCLLVGSKALADSELRRPKRGIKDSVSKDSSRNPFLPSLKDEKVQALTTRLEIVETKMEAMETSDKALRDEFKNVTQRGEIMEKKITSLSEKLHKVETSLDDDVNYWNYSSVCGGIMISQAGKIAYTEPFRLGSTYTRASCVWTIRANYRSKIYIQVTSLNPVIITELILAEDGTHAVNHSTIGPSRNYIFNGPVIFVTSPTRSLSLSYNGHGKLVHENTDFRHYYFNQPNGTFTFNERSVSPQDRKARAFTTLVTKIEPSNLVELGITIPKSCGNFSFHVQAGDEDFDEPRGNITNNATCCSKDFCDIRRYTLDGWFTATHSTLLPSDDKLGLHWKSRINQSDSIDECGGVIMGKGGRISYKKYSTYLNNERCVWVIYPFPKKSVKFLQFSSSFETTYDHVTVLEVDKNQVESTSLSGPLTLSAMKNYTGKVILVTFYTDNSIARQGFELAWEAVGPSYFDRNLENEQILHNSFKDSDTNTVSLVNEGFALYVMTNRELDGGSLSMSVRRKQGLNCPNARLTVLGTSEGHLDTSHYAVTSSLCTTALWNTVWNISSPDGVGIIILENKDAQGKLQLDVSWNFIPPETTDVNGQDKCGGVIHGTAGLLSYKVDTVYENGERCIWLIHSPSSSEIQLRLVKDGFELCCDYVLVNTIDSISGQMDNQTLMLTRENNTRVVQGNLAVVTFRADASVTGKGFVLKYTGRGQSQYTHKFKLIHLDEVFGKFIYRSHPSSSSGDGWLEESGENENNNNEDPDQNELTVIAYSTQMEAGDSSLLVFNVTIEDMVFGVDENCKFDILNFYTTPSREGFALGESYPKLECETTLHGCGNCVKSKLVGNDTIPHTFSSSFRTFVGIYKPVQSSVINNQSFHIRWDTSSGCGGVEHQDTGVGGRITYKLNSKYKNMEQCIWTVNIPNAAKIRFLLVANGFEACCDFLVLSSLDPKTGSLGSSAILKTGSISAVMNGPVVFIVFRTDSSVTGEGFSLSYNSINPEIIRASTPSSLYFSNNSSEVDDITTITSQPVKYYHYHFHRRNSSFLYPFGRNPALGPNDILTITFSPEAYKNESFLRFGTAVNIKELNLYVNNDTCTSDSLRFYEMLTGSGFNASRSYTVPILNTTSCNEEADSGEWACDNCFPNQTIADRRIVSTTYPAFVAIYKSITPDRETTTKNLMIEWIDLQRASETPSATTRGYSGR